MLSNSSCVAGTRRITIFLPSVEPMPIEASDLIDNESGKAFPTWLKGEGVYSLNSIVACSSLFAKVWSKSWCLCECKERKLWLNFLLWLSPSFGFGKLPLDEDGTSLTVWWLGRSKLLDYYKKYFQLNKFCTFIKAKISTYYTICDFICLLH